MENLNQNKPKVNSHQPRAKNLCIIPARGGSKRIPRKNIKDFLGKPIISYSIEAALKSGIFDEVMVSTDEEEIAEVSKSFGAEVPFLRSSKNSNDQSGISDVILEVLRNYEKQKKSYTKICCLLATAPFVTPEILINAEVLMNKGHCSAVFTIQEFAYPYQRGLIQSDEGELVMKWPEYLNSRSQDLEKLYHDAGQFYMSKTESFKKHENFFISGSKGILLTDLDARDIDTDADWEIAEKLFKLKIQ